MSRHIALAHQSDSGAWGISFPDFPGFLIVLAGLIHGEKLPDGVLMFVVAPSVAVSAVLGPALVWMLESRDASVWAYLACGFGLGAATAVAMTMFVIPTAFAFIVAAAIGGTYGAVVGGLIVRVSRTRCRNAFQAKVRQTPRLEIQLAAARLRDLKRRT